MSESLTRVYHIDQIRADDKGKGFSATLSTEYAVPRDYGNEILRHDKAAVDLTRAPLPLLINHDASQLNIGVVGDLRVQGGKLRGRLKFGKSARVAGIVDDVEAGVISNLSIGYEIKEHIMEGDDLIAIRWMPYEASLVSVGADPHAGIGRSYQSEKSKMQSKDDDAGDKLSRRQKAAERTLAEKERDRCADISALGEMHNQEKLAGEYIRDGKSVDDFRTAVLQRLGRAKPVAQGDADNLERHTRAFGAELPMSPDGFSIVRAIRACIDPKSREGGYELECSQELKRVTGRRTNSLLVPLGRMHRAMTTTGEGGELVPSNLNDDLFIEALRPVSAVLNLPITQISEVDGNLVIPRATANMTVTTATLDDDDTLTATDPTLDQLTLTPHSIAGMTTLSHKLILQASSDVESLVRGMLAKEISVKLDELCLQGDGTGDNPTGVLNTTGIGADTYALGGNPAWSDIVTMESNLDVANVGPANRVYLVAPALAGTLKTIEKASGTAQFVLDGNMMNGYPVIVSSNVPTGTVVLGDWAEFILATWGVLEVEINPYGATDWSKGNVSVRAILDFDIAVRHAASFTMLDESPT